MDTYGTASLDPTPLSIPGPALTSRREVARATRIAGATRLAVVEAAIALGALALVLILTHLRDMPDGLDGFLSMRVTLRNVLLLALLATGWTLIFRFCGLYDQRRVAAPARERLRVLIACSLGALLALVIARLSRDGGPAGHVLYFWMVTTIATLSVRSLRRGLLGGRRAPRRALIVGSGPRAFRQWQALIESDAPAYDVVGFVDTPTAPQPHAEVASRSVGTLNELEPLLMHQAIDEVHIALPFRSHYHEIEQAIRICERVGVQTKYRADLFDCYVAWPRFDGTDSPTVTLHVVADDHRRTIKRVVDVVGAAFGILLLSPVLLIIAAAIKATSRGPILFKQERYGLNRRRFRMFKFRSMVVDAERLQEALESRNEAKGPVFKIAKDPRVTPLGHFLRRTSLDELPQLFNVLVGDMSLVGPRPLPLRDVMKFTCASDMRRFSVPGGLTCLWQIGGRNNLSFSEWITLDLKYIDEWSLRLDFWILLRTLPAVLRGDGAQ